MITMRVPRAMLRIISALVGFLALTLLDASVLPTFPFLRSVQLPVILAALLAARGVNPRITVIAPAIAAFLGDAIGGVPFAVRASLLVAALLLAWSAVERLRVATERRSAIVVVIACSIAGGIAQSAVTWTTFNVAFAVFVRTIAVTAALACVASLIVVARRHPVPHATPSLRLH